MWCSTTSVACLLGFALGAAAMPAALSPARPGRFAQLPPRIWTTADGAPLPFVDDSEILVFLAQADIVEVSRQDEGNQLRPFGEAEDLGLGTYIVRLRDAEVEALATFRSVDDRLSIVQFRDGSTEIHFRDYGLFECAAYELARLLGVDQVPPTVERRVRGVDGSLQLRPQNTITESRRDARGLADPAEQRWQRQLATMNVFDALIANGDRNRRNLLYDEYWRMWLVDHTRAFRVGVRLPEDLQAIERALWVGLQRLSEPALREALGRYLSDREMSALLERRHRLVAHFEALIAARGESRVVYTY